MADLSIVKSEPLPLSVVKSEPLQRTFVDSVKDAGSAFWDWTGKPVAYALGLSGGTDVERGDKAREAQKQIVQGIMNEPGRIRQELTNSLDAFVAGNGRSTMHHVLNAIPLLGPGIDQAAQEFNQGQYAKGVGHTGALLAPAAAHELPAITGAVGDATRAMATGAKEVIGSYLPERTAPVATSSTMGATAASIATNPITRVAANTILPGSGKVINLMGRAKQVYDAFKGAPEAPPPAELPPGFGLSNGTTSGPIPAGAPRPVGTQPPVSGALPGTVVEAPPVRPVGPIDIGPDTRGGLSVAEQLRAYVDAQKAPPAPVTAADVAGVTPAKFAKLSPADQAAAQTTADALNRHAGRTEAPPAPVEAPSAPIQQIEQAAPRRMTLAEAEADMMAQSAPEVDTPQSQYQANGERKPSGIRAVDRETMNRTAKVSRVAQEIHEAVSKQGGRAYSQLSALPAPELEATLQSAAEMIGENKLSPASRNQIMAELKRMEATAAPPVAGPVSEAQQPVSPSENPPESGIQSSGVAKPLKPEPHQIVVLRYSSAKTKAAQLAEVATPLSKDHGTGGNYGGLVVAVESGQDFNPKTVGQQFPFTTKSGMVIDDPYHSRDYGSVVTSPDHLRTHLETQGGIRKGRVMWRMVVDRGDIINLADRDIGSPPRVTHYADGVVLRPGAKISGIERVKD